MLQHINSLRAFSVLIVVFYHFNIKIFEYGFLGVDIFLAISGFLITKIISLEVQNTKKFNIYDFILRRARRLLPVIIFILLISSFVSYFLFYDSRVFLNKSILWNYLLIPNFFFWINDINYFSENIVNSNFLKHTWSLGLEYQFYLFFSLIFFVFKKKIKILVLFFFIVSFFLDLYLISSKPSASFYLIPTRLWEFLMGSIFYFIYPKSKNFIKKIKYLDLFSIILILSTIFLFSDLSLFLKKLIIIFFSCILITFYRSIYSYKLILENRYLNYVGLISFSLYLWHYFLFKLDEYFFLDIPIYILFFISFILSIFSYNFIEKPFRNKDIYKNIFKNYFFYILCFCLLAPYFLQKENIGHYKYDSSFSKSFEVNNIGEKCFNIKFEVDAEHTNCLIGNSLSSNKNDFILLGDSIAYSLADSFDQYGKKENKRGYFFGQPSCPPLIGASFNFGIKGRNKERIEKCQTFNQEIFKFIKINKINKIIIISNWENYINKPILNTEKYSTIKNLNIEEKRAMVLKDSFKNILKEIKNNDLELIVFSQLPTLKYESAYSIVFKEIELKKKLSNKPDKKFEKILFSKNQFKEYKKISDNILNNVFQDSQVIDVTDYFCDIYCKVSENKLSLYNDKIHFSNIGSKYFFEVLSKIDF